MTNTMKNSNTRKNRNTHNKTKKRTFTKNLTHSFLGFLIKILRKCNIILYLS